MHDDIITNEAEKEAREMVFELKVWTVPCHLGSALLNIFRRKYLSTARSRPVDSYSCRMIPKFKQSVLQMSLGTNECGFLFNATLVSLVHPARLHCIVSNVVSNFKWLEWWVLSFTWPVSSPLCSGFTGLIPWYSHTAADLRKGWQSSQGFNCCLIGYSNWNILLRGHLKLASLFQKMLSHCSKSHAGRVPYT